MSRRLLTAVCVALALIAGAVGIASATAHRTARTATPASARSAVPPSTTHPSSTTTASSTTTTLPHLSPGPLAMPSPLTPVTLSERTPVIDRVPTADKVIFLGIDDGLVRDPAVLALLRQERVPLTLFLVRQPALDGRTFFQEMQNVGATVQAHTIMHPQLRKLGYSEQQHQICGDLTELTSWYGARPTLFRPPYGEWNETTRSVVASCGLRALVLWRGATNDGRLDMIGGSFHPGDILLMHFRRDLLQNLQLVFRRARAEGYRVGRLEDYLGTGPPDPMFTPTG